MSYNTTDTYKWSLIDLKDAVNDKYLSSKHVQGVLGYFEKNENTPENALTNTDLIKEIDKVLAPKIHSDDIPSEGEIQKCKNFCKSLVNFATQKNELAEKVKKLLAHFVSIIASEKHHCKNGTCKNIMVSHLKFFHILRSVRADDNSRPFNELLMKRALEDRINGRVSAINTLLDAKPLFSLFEESGLFAEKPKQEKKVSLRDRGFKRY